MPDHGGADPYTIDANDPHGELIDQSGMDPAQLERIGRLMSAMGRLRAVENRLFEESQRHMRLNETDMRAIHYLIACANKHIAVTPRMLADHLGITPASTTKLLDRLSQAGHITRQAHPADRRALTVTVTDQTRVAATNSLGRQHASRVAAAARLSPRQCQTVIEFLTQTAADLEQSLGDNM